MALTTLFIVVATEFLIAPINAISLISDQHNLLVHVLHRNVHSTRREPLVNRETSA